MNNRQQILQTIQELSAPESYNLVYHKPNGDVPMPSVNALAKIVETIQEIIFPGYFGKDIVSADTIGFYTGVNVDKLYAMLSQQIYRGIMFEGKRTALLDSPQRRLSVQSHWRALLP